MAIGSGDLVEIVSPDHRESFELFQGANTWLRVVRGMVGLVVDADVRGASAPIIALSSGHVGHVGHGHFRVLVRARDVTD